MSQDPISQSLQVPEKPKVNYWMISTLILGALFLVMLGVNLSGLGIFKKGSDVITPPPPEPPTPPISSLSSFTGTIKTGAQLGEVKSYCAEGFYLVADEDKELVEGTGTKMLLLRQPGGSDDPPMLSDPQYVGKKVEVVGKYPAAEVFCEALMCGCEDYILVDSVNVVDTKPISVEGQVVCLPHKDKTGPQTLECAYGLQDKDGTHYSLQGLNEQEVISGKIPTGRNVVITGVLVSDPNSPYNIVGTINVANVEYKE